MTENPNAPDPRIGEISKALDEFELKVRAAERGVFDKSDERELINRRYALSDARFKLMDLVRRLKNHV